MVSQILCCQVTFWSQTGRAFQMKSQNKMRSLVMPSSVNLRVSEAVTGPGKPDMSTAHSLGSPPRHPINPCSLPNIVCSSSSCSTANDKTWSNQPNASVLCSPIVFAKSNFASKHSLPKFNWECTECISKSTQLQAPFTENPCQSVECQPATNMLDRCTWIRVLLGVASPLLDASASPCSFGM